MVGDYLIELLRCRNEEIEEWIQSTNTFKEDELNKRIMII